MITVALALLEAIGKDPAKSKLFSSPYADKVLKAFTTLTPDGTLDCQNNNQNTLQKLSETYTNIFVDVFQIGTKSGVFKIFVNTWMISAWDISFSLHTCARLLQSITIVPTGIWSNGRVFKNMYGVANTIILHFFIISAYVTVDIPFGSVFDIDDLRK